MKYFNIILSLVILSLISSCGLFKRSIQLDNSQIIQLDTVVKIEPYKKIITKEAVTKNGLIKVHQVKNKYYFEISKSLLNREILVVSRFIRTPELGGYYGGEEIGERVVFFEKAPNDKILLRVKTSISRVSENDAIAQAVQNSNVAPIVEAFEINATNDATGAYVFEVTDFLNSDNYLLTLSKPQKTRYKLLSLDKGKSFISEINTYPINTEIKTVKTYKAKTSSESIYKDVPAAVLTGMVTLEINNSFVLLPKTPMRKRLYDPRVGYFASAYLKYDDNQQKVKQKAFIHRWRLEPKDEDLERWRNGRLVEPKKQIVYYIDPATPKKWVPYLIDGIQDWNIAFEAAGFKNAIVGKEWPVNDSTMSLEDARFSVIRYFASPFKNAYGPNIVDPRSGEIIESHLGWYHNLMSLLHSWYLIQVAAVDPRARNMEFDDDLMGDLIRFVSSHEVGHTLGLRHNMGASYATPVDSLRSDKWLLKHGHTSSIMDYARFNYVAQPEDSISWENLLPRVGDYDKWAILWGYTKFTKEMTLDEEKEMLSELIVNRVANNPRLWFGGEGRDNDPRSQTEDLGDNAVLASEYGIKNLKRILPNLIHWTKEHESDDYKNLKDLYTALLGQFTRYVNHVKSNIGGVYITPKSVVEEGDVYGMVSKSKQKEALNFLRDHILTEPDWLLDREVLNKIKSPQSKEDIVKTMESVMSSLLSGMLISRMGFIAERYEPLVSEDEDVKNMTTSPKDTVGTLLEVYKPQEYLDDLYDMVWNTLDMGKNFKPSIYQRHVQKAYLKSLIALYKPQKANKGLSGLMSILSQGLTVNTDTRALALSYLLSLHQDIKKTLPKVSDRMTKAHLQYMDKQIDDVFNEEVELE
ncbi:zinc-dependent metalloprotease [Aureibaculum sp. 2210JD6-5]|uniref:zinc-dependent metalloprotease n=1 Tax=Aureibaculum sp. 2210JD6-5 TaxID=3103957 RepID=UPI002AAE4777|nr:zinc-dependent metalloprotease [Aureibaculum sp. 2210JD6-5]MDY7395500.1 zinc-dependent metalloprotease [Aureibaculum sp. 2210JD6-5]